MQWLNSIWSTFFSKRNIHNHSHKLSIIPSPDTSTSIFHTDVCTYMCAIVPTIVWLCDIPLSVSWKPQASGFRNHRLRYILCMPSLPSSLSYQTFRYIWSIFSLSSTLIPFSYIIWATWCNRKSTSTAVGSSSDDSCKKHLHCQTVVAPWQTKFSRNKIKFVEIVFVRTGKRASAVCVCMRRDELLHKRHRVASCAAFALSEETVLNLYLRFIFLHDNFCIHFSFVLFWSAFVVYHLGQCRWQCTSANFSRPSPTILVFFLMLKCWVQFDWNAATWPEVHAQPIKIMLWSLSRSALVILLLPGKDYFEFVFANTLNSLSNTSFLPF